MANPGEKPGATAAHEPSPLTFEAPSWAGVVGFAAVVAVLLGVALSYGGHPDYDVKLHYVSQLAEQVNPRRIVFNAGLFVGGLLFAAFAWSLPQWLPNRDGARAGKLGLVAGTFMSLVGCFPLTVLIPHFACAFVLFTSVIFAELFAARSLRDLAARTRQSRLRWGSRLSYAMFTFHITAALGGFVYSGVVTRDMPIQSAEQMLVSAPALQQLRLWAHGPVLNPIANLEWVFLISSMALLLLASWHTWTQRQR